MTEKMEEQLDKILELLNSQDSIYDYKSICEKFSIPDKDKKYILNKLKQDGYIEIIGSKHSDSIRITENGRIFITESSYFKEKNNEIKKGNKLKNKKIIELFFKVATLILTGSTVFLLYIGNQKESIINEQKTTIENLEKQASIIDLEIQEFHNFSSKETKDAFIIHMKGNDLITSEIEFRIITSSGIEIFNHKFESNHLIGYGLVGIENPSIQLKENFILKRFYNFLDESNFKSPAIEKNTIFDNEFYNENYFDEIKNQDYSVSFYYLLGEEYMRKITYNKTRNKVVEFWSCC